MDALFGLISLTEASLTADHASAREAFIATAGGQVTQWSDDSSWLIAAPRASRPRRSDSSRIAQSSSGRYHVAVAGALHYRTDLARQLDAPASEPTIDLFGDAALAALAWDKWQHDAPTHLEGEFCLAVVDTLERSVAIVQSRLEYAPLFYVQTASWLGFSTRLLPLTRLPGIGVTLDPSGFARAVSRYQIQANDPRRTWLRGIERLPPGCAKVRGRFADRDWEYWAPDPDAVTSYRTEDEVHLEIRELLGAAVAERIRREPVTACLVSGGLDSSSLACLAARDVSDGRTIVGVAAVLREGASGDDEIDEPDERQYIQCVQRHAAIDVALVTPAADVNPWRVPDGFFDFRESPMASPRLYLASALFAAAARSGAGVVLDGSFGELGPSFAGPMPSRDRVGRHTIRRAGAAIRAFGRRLVTGSPSPRARAGIPPQPAFARWLNASLRGDALRECGLAREMADAAGPPVRSRPTDPQDRIGYPPWRKMVRCSRGGRAWGLEVTFPFRDPRLWQYCAGLPAGLAARRGYNRYLLRAAMDGILPATIQWRTTKGAFSADYYARMRRNVEWARALSDSVTRDETAAQWIDLPWMRSTLAALGPTDLCHANIDLVFMLQGTAFAIQHLRWFDGIRKDAR